MKKLVLIASVAFGVVCYAKVDIDLVEDAIEKSRVSTINAEMAKLKRDTLDLQEKKRLLENFYDASAELVDHRRESMALTGNWYDIAKTAFGTLFTLCGAIGWVGIGFIPDGYFLKPHEKNLRMLAGLMVASGIPLLYWGLTCSAQRSAIKAAEEVEKSIFSAYDEIEGALSKSQAMEA